MLNLHGTHQFGLRQKRKDLGTETVGNDSMLGLEKTRVLEGPQEDSRHLFDDFTLKQLFDISE